MLYVRPRDRKKLDCMKSRKRGEKKEKEEEMVLNCTKLEYHKEILKFINIQYYIIFFLITQISDQ